MVDKCILYLRIVSVVIASAHSVHKVSGLGIFGSVFASRTRKPSSNIINIANSHISCNQNREHFFLFAASSIVVVVDVYSVCD